MVGERVFTPNILLCGDEAEFIGRVGNRPFKITGYATFNGEKDGQKFDFAQDGKFLFEKKVDNDKEFSDMSQDPNSLAYNDFAEPHTGIYEGEDLTEMIRGGGI